MPFRLLRHKLFKIFVPTPPDFNILCFVVNSVDEPRKRTNEKPVYNRDLRKMNCIAKGLYDRFPAYSKGPLPLPAQQFFLSRSYFWCDRYKDSLQGMFNYFSMDDSLYRTQVEPVTVLRLALLNPWLSIFSEGEHYLEKFLDRLVSEAEEVTKEVNKQIVEQSTRSVSRIS